MRSIIHYRYGEPAEVLRLTEAPALPPPGAGDVLIRVRARPIHPGDLLGIRGRFRAPGIETPVGPDGVRPGTDGMGEIVAAGAGIDAARGLVPGARVAFFPARWTWSDQVRVPARFVTRVPDDVPDAVAAQLHVAPLTAVSLVRAVQAAGAVPGDVVVLSAAGALVAQLAAVLLLAQGYRLVGVVRAGAALVAQMPGMDMVSTEDQAWARTVCTRIQGRPVRVVLDPVGGGVATALMAMLADGGTLVSYGDLSGQPLVLPALGLSTRDLHVTGVSVGRWTALPDAVRARDIATVLTLAQTMPEMFRVAAAYDLQQIAAAVQHAERPGKAGTVLPQ